jgi:Calpain family cysteine protease
MQCLYGLVLNKEEGEEEGEYKPKGVLRVTQIFEDPKFFIDGANSNDIVQGDLGDCWFLSALAIMSAKEGLVENICVAVSTCCHFQVALCLY